MYKGPTLGHYARPDDQFYGTLHAMQLHIPTACIASSEGVISYEEPFVCTKNLSYGNTMYIQYTEDKSYEKLHVANMYLC